MPTLAELRSKAVKVKDASVSSLANTRDRMSSQPSKNINWHADIKPKPPPPPKPDFRPPPPPSRTSSTSSTPSTSQSKPPAPPVPSRRAGSSTNVPLARSSNPVSQTSSASPSPPPRPPPRSLNSQPSSSASPSPPPSVLGVSPGPPPPIRRDTRPDTASHASASHMLPPPMRSIQEGEADTYVDRIDWANLSLEDKQVFFSWLDEFFSRYLGVTIPPRTTAHGVDHLKVPPGGYTSHPKVPMTSRPAGSPHASSDRITCYPPPSEHDSLAEDLAHYFAPSTHWVSTWYTSESDLLAPPLRGKGDLNWTASWSHDGRTKTIHAGVFFPDLSMCWYAVAWPLNLAPTHDPNDTRVVQRTAQFLPRPSPWDGARLVAAHETYGETIASFAESYEGTGQFCARGECWDLANEALKSFAQYDWVPPPVPSVLRTHGHLMYEGKVANGGRTQAGRWRGGDDRVRRGDIVEWKVAKLSTGPYSRATLGNPDHTAVIVSDMVPHTQVADGKSVPPREMGLLEVVEQGVTSPPKRAKYDLAKLEEGEVWIYRPVPLEEYVGPALAPECPEGVNALTL
ncbi:hypothetical protein C8Q79DRAFT_932887 [Trametes meyenii]|nr:hypothetical protein C8Q79DRAFT_932887 [Trametes meyenii]